MDHATDALRYATPQIPVRQYCIELTNEEVEHRKRNRHPDKETTLLLINALSHIAIHGPQNRNMGICGNVMNLIVDQGYGWGHASRISEWIGLAAVHWEHFSGNIAYPIKDKKGFYITNKWRGQSAVYRYQLLTFLLNELARIVNEEDYNNGKAWSGS